VPHSVGPYAIGDLAALGGVSRRTVRYYVQGGLIPPPEGLGRGNHYGPEHLDALLRVKAMQEAGHTLEQIRRAQRSSDVARTAPRHPPAAAPHDEAAPVRSVWRRLPLARGVELHVQGTVDLPSAAALRELSEWCRRHLQGLLLFPDDQDEPCL